MKARIFLAASLLLASSAALAFDQIQYVIDAKVISVSDKPDDFQAIVGAVALGSTVNKHVVVKICKNGPRPFDQVTVKDQFQIALKNNPYNSLKITMTDFKNEGYCVVNAAQNFLIE